MNIVQVGPFPFSADCIRGGVESSVFGLVNELSRNHVVDVFDYPRINGKDSVERKGPLTVHRYANPGNHNQDAMDRGKEILRDIVSLHPDIVHIHGTGGLSGALYSAVKTYGIPVLLTVHGLLHIEKKNALIKHPSLKHLYQLFVQSHAEFKVLNEAEHIIVDTEYVAEQIKHLHSKKKISHLPWMYVVPQGIQSQYLQVSPKKPVIPTILSVGSISQRKSHLLLVKAFEIVHKTVPSAKLIIAGTLTEKAYYTQLQNEIGKLHLKQSVELLTNIPQEQLLQIYQEATIFALHSQEESQGIALVEAMATGLPIVSTLIGGIPFVVKNGKTGLLSKYGDVDSFANNMIKLLTIENLRTQMSQSARLSAQSYSWQEITQAIEIIYNRIITTTNH